MDPTRAAYFLFRRHLLYVSAPRTPQPPQSVNPLAPLSAINSAESQQAFKRNLSHDSVQHAIAHIQCLHKVEQTNATNNDSPSPKAGAATSPPNSSVSNFPQSASTGSTWIPVSSVLNHEVKTQTEKALEHGLQRLLRTHERFPVPQLTLVELIRSIHLHMQFHLTPQNTASGEYILKALCIFFCCEKQEALLRFCGPLLAVGCLIPRGQKVQLVTYTYTVREFEQVAFHVIRPTSTWNLPMRESLSRSVFIMSPRSVVDGATELIYTSHSRWVYGPPPAVTAQDDASPGGGGTTQADIDSPFSQFPDQLRRGLLGPLLQYVQGFCMNECKMSECVADTCAIIRLDGVKFAVAQLTPSSMPALLHNKESNKMDKMDCPVNLVVGFPERIPDNVIWMGMKKILDVVELTEGLRSQLPYRHSTAEEFRLTLRRIGSRVFAMASQLFFRPEAPESVYIDPGIRAQNKSSNLFFLLDNGVETTRLLRPKRAVTAFPNVVPFAMNSRPSTHVLSRKTCSMAMQLLLSLRDACAPVGTCITCVILYHGHVVLSDCHPYITALLTMRAQLSFYDSCKPADTCNEREAEKCASVLQDIMDLWTCTPARYQMPTGVFADSLYGEDACGDDAGASGLSGNQTESDRFERETSSGQAHFSSTLESEDPNAIYLQPHLLPISAYLSPALAGLLQVPKVCGGRAAEEAAAAVGAGPHGTVPTKRVVAAFAQSFGGCADNATRPLSEGTYNGVHLASGGVDVILLLGNSKSGDPVDGDDDRTNPDVICEHFRGELSMSARDMNALANHISRHDTIQRKVELPKDGSNAEAERHVDPLASSGTQTKGTPGSPVTTTQAPADGAPNFYCMVNDLALGTAHFLDGSLGPQDDVPLVQRQSANSTTLNRATTFLAESNTLANILGGSLRLPKRFPDEINSVNYPFATEACTRVVLGRNAFAVGDKKGPHNTLFARQSGGQQVYYGTQVANLRNVEDQYLAYAAVTKALAVI